MKIANWIIPSSPRYDGNKFFTFKNNKRLATPLLTCLICIELSDFVFAIDSIPAVLGITKDPVIVYASNIFAILALRSLYTVVAKAVEDLVYLRPAVAMVLTFVGCKMAGEVRQELDYYDATNSDSNSSLLFTVLPLRGQHRNQLSRGGGIVGCRGWGQRAEEDLEEEIN